MQTVMKSQEETENLTVNNIQWIEDWYKNECNGDWEHTYGISIQTIDNPGWMIQIDLQDTSLENLHIDPEKAEISDFDWYALQIKDKKFTAAGDPAKFNFLLGKFRELATKAV